MMKELVVVKRRLLTRMVGVVLLALSGSQLAWAALGTSVTLASGSATDIYPGQSTTLRITLSNDNGTSVLSGVSFSNILPGTLPNGLKVSGTPTYSCADASGAVATTGSVTASLGSQSILLAGGTIPAKSGSTDGFCVIDVPVTSGTNSGNATTYTYTIGSGAVTGNDGAAQANSGSVSQSINVRALSKPSISKNMGGTTLILGGSSTTLNITITNPNLVAISGVSIIDVFPAAANPNAGGASQGIIKVAVVPAASATCAGGIDPMFNPVAGDTTLSATGATIAANGTCTLAVAVEANHTGGAYSLAQTNTINATTQFSNDIGIPAAANATGNLTVRSPLSVSKTGPLSLAAGQIGQFLVTLTNDGPTPLPATFTDSPIDGIAGGGYGLITSGVATTCGGVAAITGGSEGVTLTGGTIPANGNCTLTIDFTGALQTANTPQAFTNTLATGAVDVGNTAIVSQQATATVTIYDTFNIAKAGPTPNNATAGGPVSYQVTVQNWTGSAMTNVAVTDALANGQTFLSGSINGVNYTPTVTGGCGAVSTSSAVGDTTANLLISTVPQRTNSTTPGSCTVTFWAMTSSSAANNSVYSNQLASGTVCHNPSGGNICNGTPSNNVSANTAAVLSVSKGFSPGGPLNEGAITRMTIAMSNLSVNSLTNIAISDNLPLASSGGGQMRVANPANAATTCGGSAVITALAGSTSVQMNGATVPARAAGGTGAAGTCNLQVDVIAPAGIYINTASVVGSQTYANGVTASNVGPVTANAGVTFNSVLCSAGAPCTKTFSPTSVSSGGRSTVTLRLVNSGALALTGVAATDPLPTGMVVANPANAYTTCNGSTTVTATAGAGSLSLSGASIAGNATCDLVFDVTVNGSANWVNTIPLSNITANGGVSNQTPVSGTLNFVAPTNLTVAKVTNPSTLTFPGQVSQLTITVTDGSVPVTGLAFTDHFTIDGTVGTAMNGMVIAPSPSASTTCPSGTVTATPGSNFVQLSGATLAATTSCSVSVNVTSTAVGGITNYIPAGGIQTIQGLTNSGQATTSITTQSKFGITKKFTPNVVKPGERSRLRISFYNPTAQPVTNLSVTDNLPVGVTVPSGANPVSTCPGATVSAPTSGRVQVSGASVVAASGGIAASCYAEIDVLVVAAGDYFNTIAAGAINATVGGTRVTNAHSASDTLRAKFPMVVHKAFSNLTLDSTNPSPFVTGTDSKAPGALAVLTIRLANPNGADLTAVAFVDSLPANLVVATTPNASTTCANGVVTAAASGTSVRLSGATVPAAGSCTVTVNVSSNIPAAYTNTIPAGSITSLEGVTNEEPTSAGLMVSTPPTVGKQFSPTVIAPGGISTLTFFLGNSNAGVMTLSSAFTDTLPTAPGNIVVASTPNVFKTCPGAVTAVAGEGTVSYASGAQVPSGGCTISVDVTGTSAGVYTNNIPAGALVTDLGSNQQPANAGLSVSTLGFVSGKVFKDNNVIPNGIFEPATDTPISGVLIELRNGATCLGTLVSQVGLTNPSVTDAQGNYTFAGLAAGTYSVCQPAQPVGTLNGSTTAGAITTVSGSTGTAGTASNQSSTSSQISNIVLSGGSGGSVSGSANNNFAEIAYSSISGTVFLDQNNNGVQNGADTGIAGVAVTLTGYSYGPNGVDNAGAGDDVAVSLNTTTDTSGNYFFTNLAPGQYTVTEPIQPSGTSNGITTAGEVPNGGLPGSVTGVTVLPSSIGGSSHITLPPGTASTGNNFAEVPNGRILSGRVFVDYNNNGLFDGSDYGLPGQTLNLTGTDLNGNAVTRSAVTGSDGSYSFANLPEPNGGGYTVIQPTQPAGTSNGITSVGSTGGAATNTGTRPSVITGINLVGTNTVSANNDFAEIPGPAPDLAIVKIHSPTSFAAGSSTGFFTITPSNLGSVATNGTITIVDTLPAGLTVAQIPTGSGWACAGAVGATSFSCTTSEVIGASSNGQSITARVAVVPGLEGQILTNTAVISGGSEPVGLSGNNTATDTVAIATVAGVRGRVWLDKDHDRVFSGGTNDIPQAGWKVELLLNGTPVASTITGSDGSYSFLSVAPGSGYKIQFRHPTTDLIWGRAVPNEQGIAYSSGVNSGNTDLSTGIRSGANPAGAVVTDGTLSNLTFTSTTTTIEQSLPLDPAGVVYDSVTRQPIAGAVVTINGPAGFNPAIHLVGGTNTAATGTDGLYQFLLNPSAPSGLYTLGLTTYPAGYSTQPSSLIPVCSGTLSVVNIPNPASVQTSVTAPPTAATAHLPYSCPTSTAALNSANQGSTQYYFSFNITSGTSATVVNNHIPLDPLSASGFVLSKTGDKRVAEVGDTVRYTITVRLNSSSVLPQVTVRDRLPAGFTFVRGTAQVNGVAVADPIGGLGPVLGFNLGALRGSTNTAITSPSVIKLQYRVRVGVGAQQGTGLNTAVAYGCSNPVSCLTATTLVPLANSVVSNEGRHQVVVSGGVFTDAACVLGKIFVDCDNNHIQDPEELGIPGVRLYFEDGFYVVSDVEGKYSRCGLSPRSHVISPDPTTLPIGTRLTTSSNRNLGDANSLFIDLKKGELYRADFVEGSCSNRVMDQVKARRTQGEVRSIELERPDGPALRFKSKSTGYPQQGTDGANQPLVLPRQGASDAR